MADVLKSPGLFQQGQIQEISRAMTDLFRVMRPAVEAASEYVAAHDQQHQQQVGAQR